MSFDNTNLANENNERDPNDEIVEPKITENVLDSEGSNSSSSSGYDYPLDHEVQVEILKPMTHPVVPKLNFGGKLPLKLGAEKPSLAIPQNVNPPLPPMKIPNLGMNLENIKKKDFQDEFMEKFDEYSKSWRDMIEQQKRF